MIWPGQVRKDFREEICKILMTSFNIYGVPHTHPSCSQTPTGCLTSQLNSDAIVRKQNKIHPSKFKDKIGFAQPYMDWAASPLANGKEL